MNILVIEDDRRIAGLIQRGLSENGHVVTLAPDGRQGLKMILEGAYDAALLDILLPGMDGLAVLEHARTQRCKTAIMVLSAVDTVPNILQAFDLGADDYVVKPFLLEILLARLGAISRRRQTVQSPVLRAGDLTLDRSRHKVVRNGRSIHLTRKQFELLDLLMRRHGLVTSREDLIEAAWGHAADVKGNTLDVYMHGLRAKLDAEPVPTQTMIRTIHGSGYMLVADQEA
ncbi:MAG TPA: response regulator transcription factor [Acidobacteriaceae bacterium]|jgi:two-component system copper resistance phosphate regulon response regulator CusR